MRTYEETHPWIKFEIDQESIPANLLVLLGECQSKCEHIANTPLRPDVAQKMFRVCLAKGTQATMAIEGDTLSEEEIEKHMEGKLKLPLSRQYLQKEADNFISEFNHIFKNAIEGKTPLLAPAIIQDFNRKILNGLPLEKDVVPGKIRKHAVGVGLYRGAPAEDCEYLLKRLCDWIEGDEFAPSSEEENLRIVYAVLKAVITHLYLAWIHPFGEGNGRTARLVEFMLLASAGVPAPAAHLLSNHYNQTRTEYYRQLENASVSGGDIVPFLNYAVQGFLDGLKDQLISIREQVWDATWTNYVHELFKDKKGEASRRRRHLILDMGVDFVSVSDLTGVSPRIARWYAGKTNKMLNRDINELIKMNLVQKKGKEVRARKEIVLSALPPRAHVSSSINVDSSK